MSHRPTHSDPIIQDIKQKIKREKTIVDASRQARQSYLANPTLLQKCDSNIREANTNIDYLEQTLSKIQVSEESDKKIPGNDQDNNLALDKTGMEKVSSGM